MDKIAIHFDISVQDLARLIAAEMVSRQPAGLREQIFLRGLVHEELSQHGKRRTRWSQPAKEPRTLVAGQRITLELAPDTHARLCDVAAFHPFAPFARGIFLGGLKSYLAAKRYSFQRLVRAAV